MSDGDLIGYIYKITNTVNGKVYIGQTKYTIQERWKQHIYGAMHYGNKYDDHFHRAIRKYGAESFSVEPVEECAEEYMNDRECYWIRYYDSVRTGYNMTYGGEGHTLYSDEELLNAWSSGMTLTEISNAVGMSSHRMSYRLKTLGITESEINKRRYESMARQKSKPIYQYDLDGYFIAEYPSLTSAEEKYQCQTIGAAVLGATKTSCGYQWRPFKTDKISSYHSNNFGQPKRVYQFTLDGTYIGSYASAADAARAIGKDVANLCAVCKGRQKSCGGYVWKYDYEEACA